MSQGLHFDISLVRNTSFSCQGRIIDFAKFQLPISDLTLAPGKQITILSYSIGGPHEMAILVFPHPGAYFAETVTKRSLLVFLVLPFVVCVSL